MSHPLNVTALTVKTANIIVFAQRFQMRLCTVTKKPLKWWRLKSSTIFLMYAKLASANIFSPFTQFMQIVKLLSISLSFLSPTDIVKILSIFLSFNFFLHFSLTYGIIVMRDGVSQNFPLYSFSCFSCTGESVTYGTMGDSPPICGNEHTTVQLR